MVPILGENSMPFWSMRSRRVAQIHPSLKDIGPKDIGYIMRIGNLILGVNSVTVSYLIRFDKMQQILLQNATAI